MIRRRLVYLLALLALTGSLSIVPPARAADDDPAAIMKEMQQLAKEKATNLEKLKSNLNLQETERKFELDVRAHQAADREAEAANNAVCSRWSCSSGSASGLRFVAKCEDDASCKSAVDDYNAKNRTRNALLDRVKAEEAEIKKASDTQQELMNRNLQIDTRLAVLQGKLRTKRALDFTVARQNCEKSLAQSQDPLHQDASSCWDNAVSAAGLKSVSEETGRVWIDREARAREAIDKYTRSGPIRPGPTTFKPIVPPLPEPVLQRQDQTKQKPK